MSLRFTPSLEATSDRLPFVKLKKESHSFRPFTNSLSLSLSDRKNNIFISSWNHTLRLESCFFFFLPLFLSLFLVLLDSLDFSFFSSFLFFFLLQFSPNRDGGLERKSFEEPERWRRRRRRRCCGEELSLRNTRSPLGRIFLYSFFLVVFSRQSTRSLLASRRP